jgi:hypothetical protein
MNNGLLRILSSFYTDYIALKVKSTADSEVAMNKARWAALANFFFPGAGYLIAGIKRDIAFLWLLGVVTLTYVEFGIRESEPNLYWVMFVAVFVMNAAFAIDVYRLSSTGEEG